MRVEACRGNSDLAVVKVINNVSRAQESIT